MSVPLETARYSGTEFLEGVAHELRGPAGVTLGALDEIELALGADAERVRPLLSIARRGARRLLRTADRLSLTGRLEAKRGNADRELVDLRELTGKAARDAEELEAKKGVLVLVTHSERPCVASVDPSWLRTVIVELVGHAIRRAKTSVCVETALSGDAVHVTIDDDGVDRPKPVIRSSETREKDKLALSISLARDIAAAHGGSLFVEQRRGSDPRKKQGASMLLVLPIANQG